MKPLIGITANYSYDDAHGTNDGIGGKLQQWHLIAHDYIHAVERAGGIPVIIPVCENIETAIEMIPRLDGIIISGGNDVNPIYYNEPVSSKVGAITPNRDRMELAITKYVLEKTDIPMLMICRGIQILNVACGGTIYQDMLSEGLENHLIVNLPMNEVSHAVNVEKDSILYNIQNREVLFVNSFHHQAVKQVGKRLIVTATDSNKIVEAMEYSGRKAFTLAIQWHPEALVDNYKEHLEIFKAFINQSRGEK